MDRGTTLGLLAGVGVVAVAALQGGSGRDLFDAGSLLIVIGGTGAATLIQHPWSQVRAVLRTLRRTLFAPPEDPGDAIRRMVQLAGHARREGLLALDAVAATEPDSFRRRALDLVVDGTDVDRVRTVLEDELALMAARHRAGAAVMDTMAQMAPAFGMVGTLIGLVQMLRSLDDPARIGPGLAIALLTTLYGATLSYLVFAPLAGKLRILTAAELLSKEIVLAGILAILSGETPRLVGQRLLGFLPPYQRSAAGNSANRAEEDDVLAQVAPPQRPAGLPRRTVDAHL